MTIDRMLGPAEALAEASELRLVCAARNLVTTELFEPNAFYGSDQVLKTYGGVPLDEALRLVVPHGIVFDESYVWEAERNAMLPVVLAYGPNRESAYRRATHKSVIRSAPPFAYVAKLLEGSASPSRAGTLFFPSHSTHRVTSHADYEGIAEALLRLDEKFRPVTVCIYWRDYELGHHLPFERRGLRIVSAGHIFDSKFLLRLYYLLRSHAYAASNALGSYAAYAAMTACNFFLLHGYEAVHTGAPSVLAADRSGFGRTAAALEQAFGTPSEGLTPAQRRLLEQVCDFGRVLSPESLRGALQMAERLDRFGIARSPLDRRLYLRFPCHYARAGRRALRFRSLLRGALKP